MNSCCFTGHRNVTVLARKEIIPPLCEKIEQLINEGVAVFINGGALGFDALSALCVLSLKVKYPHIKLKIYVPHQGQEDRWSEENKKTYRYILSKADEVKILAPFHSVGCMQTRNRRMVDDSDCVIAYVRKNSGGAYYTACYAEAQDKKVFYI
ncbi:MAG: DUF1273 family protein [Clostridia bacterium]|nr:DUF1273 family protein [Clostridia bacterium]